MILLLAILCIPCAWITFIEVRASGWEPLSIWFAFLTTLGIVTVLLYFFAYDLLLRIASI